MGISFRNVLKKLHMPRVVFILPAICSLGELQGRSYHKAIYCGGVFDLTP